MGVSSPRRVGVIDRRAKCRGTISPDQVDEAFEIGPGERIGEEDVACTGGGGHFGLGDGCAFVFVNPHRLGETDNLGHLVGLHVGPQPCRVSGQGNHRLDVSANNLGIDHERRAEQFRHVVDHVVSVRHGKNDLKVASRCRDNRTRIQKAMPLLLVNMKLIEQALANRTQKRLDRFGQVGG
jgi:hypothetical protein